jgi:REP element-mobilizing transposase RayT
MGRRARERGAQKEAGARECRSPRARRASAVGTGAGYVALPAVVTSPPVRIPYRACRDRSNESARRGRFRIAHFSVQENHVHLLVEAESRRDLLGGMRGFSVSLTRQINRLLMRSGSLLADRWHARALKTPRMVRYALLYVLANGRKHGVTTGLVDPLSSAPYFAGFRQCAGRAPCVVEPRLLPRSVRSRPPPIVAPATWLLCNGWRRGGLLSIHDTPKAAR